MTWYAWKRWRFAGAPRSRTCGGVYDGDGLWVPVPLVGRVWFLWRRGAWP